jgi:hypothetical protein
MSIENRKHVLWWFVLAGCQTTPRETAKSAVQLAANKPTLSPLDPALTDTFAFQPKSTDISAALLLSFPHLRISYSATPLESALPRYPRLWCKGRFIATPTAFVSRY